MDPLLAANFEDVIGLIITLAIIGFSVLSQVLGGGDKAKKQQQTRRLQQQQQQRRRQANQPPPNSIESEIEQFLRQARGDAPPQPVEAQPIEVEVEEVVRTLVHEPMDVQPIEVEPIEPGKGFGRELSSHVESHIGRDSISQRDAHLGDVVEAADERLEQHLETVFDHDVGHLAHYDQVDTSISEGTDAGSWDEKAEQASLATEIAAMLKSPDSLRKMFIASEIFKRPEI